MDLRKKWCRWNSLQGTLVLEEGENVRNCFYGQHTMYIQQKHYWYDGFVADKGLCSAGSLWVLSEIGAQCSLILVPGARIPYLSRWECFTKDALKRWAVVYLPQGMLTLSGLLNSDGEPSFREITCLLLSFTLQAVFRARWWLPGRNIHVHRAKPAHKGEIILLLIRLVDLNGHLLLFLCLTGVFFWMLNSSTFLLSVISKPCGLPNCKNLFGTVRLLILVG